MRRASSKRKINLMKTHALFKRRSRLMPLLIQCQLVDISTLTDNIDFNILLDIRVEAAVSIDVVTRPRLAPVFHVRELHNPNYPLLTLAESDIRHGV